MPSYPASQSVGAAPQDVPDWAERAAEKGSTVQLAADGMLQVSTSTSTYLLDMKTRRLTRQPGLIDGQTFAVSSLRRDHESVALVSLESLELGQPMVVTLTGLALVGDTVRVTTPVTAVRWARRPTGPVPAELAVVVGQALG